MSSDAVWGYFAVTLQLLRFSMDLIQVASNAAEPHHSTTTGSKGHHGGNGGNSYGATSYHNERSTAKHDNQSTINPDNDDAEAQPLLAISFNQNMGTVNARFRVLGTAWALLAAAFIGIVVKGHLSADIVLQILTLLAILLEIGLLARDPSRKRYGALAKSLQFLGALLLWWSYTKHVTQMSGVGNVLALVAVSVFVTLCVLDSCWGRAQRNRVERRTSKMLSRKAIVALLQPYFWPNATEDESALTNRVRAFLTWICVIASKACGLVAPLCIGWATTALAHQEYPAVIVHVCQYAIITLFARIFSEGQSVVYLKVKQAAFVQLAETAFGHLHALSLDWHLKKKLGEVLRSMDRGIDACNTLMTYLFLWLVPAMVECIVVCVIFATYFDYIPLAMNVFYFVFIYVVWTILVTLWRKKFRKALVQSDNEWHDRFTDSMVNFETVKFFTAEEYEQERFRHAVNQYQAGSVNVQASLSFLNISQQMLLQTCLAASLSLATWGIKKRIDCCVQTVGCESGLSDCCRNVANSICPGMQVGDFVAVLSYTLNLFAPLNFLGSIYNAVVMAIVDLGNLSELLAENPDVKDATDAMQLPLLNSNDPDTVVEFDNVSFHYPSQSSERGLKGVSFKMKRGTTTAIVGPTGAGKTTISRLLFRFYDVLGGAVKVNGVDVRSVSQVSLRGAIGVVPQSASMFNDTIRSNLLYGRRDATNEELEQAARDAQLMDFIESLPDGWDTIVGDRGLKLSGGEKQRAAIARCLLKDPPIVLLDEATSALDTLTEASVQEALDRLGKKRTVLVIAHRLGTIRNADNIIVLKGGKVVEEGTHDQLLLRNGVYAEMWNRQLHSTSTSGSRSSLGALVEEE